MLMDSMEKNYQEALRQSKHSDSNESLFETQWTYKTFEKACLEQTVELEEAKEPEDTQEVTERVKILDSLHRFGNEEIEKTDKKALLFPGGEVHLKDQANTAAANSEKAVAMSSKELKQEVIKKIGAELSFSRFGESLVREQTKVLFVSDLFNNEIDELVEDKSIMPLSTCFNLEVSQLFSRMIKAMGIAENEFILSAISYDSPEGEKDYFEMLKSEVLFYKPTLIITLGAQATNSLLKLKSRLKDIHGNFYQLVLEDQSHTSHNFEVMPLFSPTLLQTAPNMKKTAWKDMQKAMSKLSL